MSNRIKRKDRGPQFSPQGLIQSVTMPDDEKVLLKQVPAVVTHPETGEKVKVGIANLYDDGSVDQILDPDAPQWAMDLIKATMMEFGYTMGLKENDGSS